MTIQGDDPFFKVTKQLHNTLQGARLPFPKADWDTYMELNQREAASLSREYDLVFVHDPQPLPLRRFAADSPAKWVWRCHIDMSDPYEEAWNPLKEMVKDYDAAVFSLAEFVKQDGSLPPVAIIPPAIDPHTPKNRAMSWKRAAKVVAEYGVDPLRPFISQVSRFDPWKDPLGVIDCFKMLRRRHPNLQLALLGNFADDDPEGREIHAQVVKAARHLTDVHIITNLTDLVSPFQQPSQLVLQKSLREGFGLTVTEALWKGTPVVAGKVGGICLQIMDGVGGFLVDSVEECADRVGYLLRNEGERRRLAEAGRDHVRSNFLLPRLLYDEPTLALGLLGAHAPLPKAPEISRAAVPAL